MKTLLVSLAAAIAATAPADARLIARLAPGADPRAVAYAHRLTYLDRTDDGPFALFRGTSEADVHRAQSEMAADAAVVWAEDDDDLVAPEKAQAPTVTNKGSIMPVVGDRLALYPYNAGAFAAVGWSRALADAPGKRAVRVAILDTGIGERQPALWAKVDASANFIERGKPAYDRAPGVDSNGNGAVDESVGHGTFVAGIVDQLAPQARLVVARVADSDGTATAWSLIKGLSFAAAQKCELANVSLGNLDGVVAINDVLDYCESMGLVVVAASGNDGVSHACSPARSSKAIAVSGLLPDLVRAPFSNWESGVDASAPATGILSQWWDGRTAVWSGTSFSTPIVTALLADAARRSSAPVKPSRFRDAVKNSGSRPDNQNPDLKGKLGVVPDHGRLVRAFGG